MGQSRRQAVRKWRGSTQVPISILWGDRQQWQFYIEYYRYVIGQQHRIVKSLRPGFHQDLNGDGVIGIPTTVIKSYGSTGLVQVGNNYFVDPVAGGTRPELKVNGAAVTAGQFGAGSQLGQSRRQAGTKSRGSTPVPISILRGRPTAVAILHRILSVRHRAAAPHWSRLSLPFIRISTAMA